MKKIILVILTFCCFSFIVNAEELKLDWQKNFDVKYNSMLLEDKNILYYENENNQYHIEKRDLEGKLIWKQSFGGSGMNHFGKIIETTNNEKTATQNL